MFGTIFWNFWILVVSLWEKGPFSVSIVTCKVYFFSS